MDSVRDSKELWAERILHFVWLIASISLLLAMLIISLTSLPEELPDDLVSTKTIVSAHHLSSMPQRKFIAKLMPKQQSSEHRLLAHDNIKNNPIPLHTKAVNKMDNNVNMDGFAQAKTAYRTKNGEITLLGKQRNTAKTPN